MGPVSRGGDACAPPAWSPAPAEGQALQHTSKADAGTLDNFFYGNYSSNICLLMFLHLKLNYGASTHFKNLSNSPSNDNS